LPDLISPQGVDQPLGGDRLADLQGDDRQQAACASARNVKSPAPSTHLDRSEQADVDVGWPAVLSAHEPTLRATQLALVKF
jgi:hypothetical protein